ncbi:hypothetical protein Tco_1238092 [Tanacetum coccineum]
MNGGDVTDHIAKVLEITEWIKMPNVEKNELRLHVFSKSLSGDAEKWWKNEINGTTITWSELNDNFFHKYYSLSYTCNSKVPDDMDNETNYFEFIYWLASKFDKYWEIDKNTKNRLWEFYVNEHAKGTIGDLDEYKEPCTNTCSDTFYKPYLDAQEAKDIYEVINREYSPIPIPARHDIDNPNELCRNEEFTVHVLHLPRTLQQKRSRMGSNTDEMKEGRKKEPYGDLAETMIWYILKKTCVELIRHSEALVNTLFAQELILENYHEQTIREFSVLILFSLII